jgi:hypothetical protein
MQHAAFGHANQQLSYLVPSKTVQGLLFTFYYVAYKTQRVQLNLSHNMWAPGSTRGHSCASEDDLNQDVADELCRPSSHQHISSHIGKVEPSKPVNIAQSSGTHRYCGPASGPGLVVET